MFMLSFSANDRKSAAWLHVTVSMWRWHQCDRMKFQSEAESEGQAVAVMKLLQRRWNKLCAL